MRPDGEALSHAQRELLGGSFHANARLWPEHALLFCFSPPPERAVALHKVPQRVRQGLPKWVLPEGGINGATAEQEATLAQTAAQEPLALLSVGVRLAQVVLGEEPS